MVPCFLCGKDVVSCRCRWPETQTPEQEIAFLKMCMLRDLESAEGPEDMPGDMRFYVNRAEHYKDMLEEAVTKYGGMEEPS